jgi:hypothetical protein
VLTVAHTRIRPEPPPADRARPLPGLRHRASSSAPTTLWRPARMTRQRSAKVTHARNGIGNRRRGERYHPRRRRACCLSHHPRRRRALSVAAGFAATWRARGWRACGAGSGSSLD